MRAWTTLRLRVAAVLPAALGDRLAPELADLRALVRVVLRNRALDRRLDEWISEVALLIQTRPGIERAARALYGLTAAVALVETTVAEDDSDAHELRRVGGPEGFERFVVFAGSVAGIDTSPLMTRPRR